MREIVAVILLLTAPVTFTDTEPIGSATPNSLTSDVRIEDPYHTNTSADLRRDIASNYTVHIDTPVENETVVYVAIDNRNVLQETELQPGDLTLRSNGELKEFNTTDDLNRTWVRTTVSGNTTLTLQPSGVSQDKSFLGSIQRLFFNSPASLFLVGGFIVFLILVIYQWRSTETEYF